MSNKLYVGNLTWETTSDELGQFFAQAGEVINAVIISDRDTGRSRGFGFVEMATKEGAETALALDGQDFNGRRVKVNEAAPERSATRPRETSRPGDPGGREPRRETHHPEETAFMKVIKKFIKVADPRENISFTSDGKHFVLTRDDQPGQPVGNDSQPVENDDLPHPTEFKGQPITSEPVENDGKS